jgi:hypothetical protein
MHDAASGFVRHFRLRDALLFLRCGIVSEFRLLALLGSAVATNKSPPGIILVDLLVWNAVRAASGSRAVSGAEGAVEQAEGRTEELLYKVLPNAIVDRLREHPTDSIADAFEHTSILFSDIQDLYRCQNRWGRVAPWR